MHSAVHVPCLAMRGWGLKTPPAVEEGVVAAVFFLPPFSLTSLMLFSGSNPEDTETAQAHLATGILNNTKGELSTNHDGKILFNSPAISICSRETCA